MAEPVKYNIKTYQGDRYEIFFRVRERTWDTVNSEWVLGDYITLTGTPSGKIKVERGEGPVIASFDCRLTNQDTIKGGLIAVLLPTEAAKLTEKKYEYDIQTKIDADHIQTWLTGKVTNTLQVDDSE